MSENKVYDLIILGGGPAGVSAAIYASRGMLDCLLIDSSIIGGQLNWTQNIENYPGYPIITGMELIQKFEEQLNKLNVNIALMKEIVNVDIKSRIKTINTTEETYKTKSIIICTGANPKKIGVKGENEFLGRGVSYCAICDGAFFKGKDVAVVGGGNSALEESVYLTKFAKHVSIIHRRDEFRANKLYQKHVFDNPNISVIWDTVVEEIQGTDSGVNNMVLKNVITGNLSNLKIDGVFPFIGLKANTDLFKGQLNLSEDGYILTEPDMSTNVDGIFAAGDVRNTLLRQIVVSAADGAIAATSAIKYIDTIIEENVVTK